MSASSPVVRCQARSSLWRGSCCEGLRALSLLAGITRVLKAMNLNVTNTNYAMRGLMPSWTLSWPLLSIAVLPQPVPGATVVFYIKVSELKEINFGARDILLDCLIPQWSLIKPQPVWIILEYVTEVEWSRVLVFPLEVPEVFCIPKQIICFGC